MAMLLARQRTNPMVKAVRANQWVARGEQLSPTELELATRQVFQHAGRCFVDLYKNMGDRAALDRFLLDTEATRNLVVQSRSGNHGAFLVAPHLSNFDLVILAIAYRGIQMQLLTYGQPTGGYQIQNEIRTSTGLDMTPVSDNSQRKAIERLRNGGMVATGVDRPIHKKAHVLQFFGRPSPLPAGHIRMALAAQVPVIVVSAYMHPDGRYEMQISEPIPMQPHPDQETAIRINGEAVLEVIAGHIRKAPQQWLMYYPVWPEVEV